MTSQQADPPAYGSKEDQTSFKQEKERCVVHPSCSTLDEPLLIMYANSTFNRQLCEHGTASQTPHIDAQLQQPKARAALLALSTTFAAAAEEDRCLKCTVESVIPELSVWMQDMKAKKKNGEISKEDKKALKTEMKWLFKGMKKDVKTMWKQQAGETAA